MANDLFAMDYPNRHWGCRVNDRVTFYGMRSMILQNELLEIVLHIDKGTEITHFLYKPLDVDFLWRARNELHNPATFTTVGGNDSAQFFDHWSGGWFEVLPNNGPGAVYKNCSLGFYAETINAPWEYKILEDTPERVRVGFWFKTYRTPYIIQKIMTIESGKPALFIEEKVTNIGGEEVDFAWGQHPVVGPPFLDGSCRISMPDCKIMVFNDEDGPGYRMQLHQEGKWPFIIGVDGKQLDMRVVLPPEAKTMDDCYITDFKDEAFIGVTNTNKKVGFGLTWDPAVFRYLWLWQAFGGGQQFPWFSSTYQMGIEPWSGYPCSGLQAAIENKSALKLGPGESLTSWLTAVAYQGDRDVVSIKRNGNVGFAK